MKKSILILTAILIASVSNAQNWKINSISLQTGETPLTKGMTATAEISKGNHLIIADYNNDLGEILYFYCPIDQAAFGVSGGFFLNVPWIAPIASLNLFNGHLKTLHWVGWSAGDPANGNVSEDFAFLFSFQQATLVFGGTEISYALQHYQKMFPEHIFALKQNFKLNENLSMFGGIGYMKTADHFLWSTGIKYNF